MSMVCRYTSMLTTAKFTVPVGLLLLLLCHLTSQNALTIFLVGCDQIDFNWTLTKLKWCGVHLLAGYHNFPVLLSSYGAYGAYVHPVSSVRDLGVFIDCDLGAATHVRKTVSRCFAALRQLRHLRRYVTDDCSRLLVVSFIHQRLDFGNFILVRLPAYLQQQLQSVLNAAARLVFRLRRYDHITDALAVLHWLRLPQRVDYKVAVMAFRALHGLAPPYLDQLVRVAMICLVDAVCAHHQHTSCSFLLIVLPLAVVRFQSLHLSSGTLSNLTLGEGAGEKIMWHRRMIIRSL